MGTLKERLFAPERLELLLQALADQQVRRAAESSGRLLVLQAAADYAKARLTRLYRAIEDGIVDDEDTILKESIAALRDEQGKAQAELDPRQAASVSRRCHRRQNVSPTSVA